MPNTKAAKKALRVSKRKQKINKVKKFNIKNAMKELKRVLKSKPKKHREALDKVFSALDKATKSNYIPKKRADRKKSRITKMVKEAAGDVVPGEGKKKVATPKAKPAAKKPTAKKTNVKKESATKTAAKKAPAKKPAAKKTPAKKKEEKK